MGPGARLARGLIVAPVVPGPFRMLGLNRGMLVRRLTQLGHPRLRRWEARRRANPLLRAAVAPARWWLDREPIYVPSGLGVGLKLSKRDLPMSHAHVGSIAYGTLESSVQEALLRHLGADDVLYDIGANVGFFALLGARLVGPAGRVVAFEAAPANAAAIRRNAQLNGFANIEVIQKAVAASSGRGRLQLVDDLSWSKLEGYGAHPGTEQVVDVELVAIDDLVGRTASDGGLPPPAVVKIDVEGAELAVLEGMRETIARHRPAIVCELHDTHAGFVTLMHDVGYRTINLEGKAPVAEAGASAHALALPRPDR